jgi:hypothetical protein
VLLEGKLRQSVATDERCCRFAADQGLGGDLRATLGQLESEAAEIAGALEQAFAGDSTDLPYALSELKISLEVIIDPARICCKFSSRCVE